MTWSRKMRGRWVCWVGGDGSGVCRMREMSDQQKRLETELEDVRKKLRSSQQTHQALYDEHQALQMAYSSHEKKLKEVETENDRLVSSQTHCGLPG